VYVLPVPLVNVSEADPDDTEGTTKVIHKIDRSSRYSRCARLWFASKPSLTKIAVSRRITKAHSLRRQFLQALPQFDVAPCFAGVPFAHLVLLHRVTRACPKSVGSTSFLQAHLYVSAPRSRAVGIRTADFQGPSNTVVRQTDAKELNKRIELPDKLTALTQSGGECAE
jgi:hypothetical protein